MTRRRHALWLGLVASLAIAVGSCGGQDHEDKNEGRGNAKRTASISAGESTTADLQRFLIKPSDVPAGYDKQAKSFVSPETCLAVQNNPAAARELKQKLERLGFESCASTSYRREQEQDGVTRNNQVASSALLMRDAEAATDALPVLRKVLLASFKVTGSATGFDPHSTPATGLGDEAPRGLVFSGSLGPVLGPATFWVYIWRRGNVVVLTGVSSVLGDFDRGSALELAQTLDGRGAS